MNDGLITVELSMHFELKIEMLRREVNVERKGDCPPALRKFICSVQPENYRK